MSETKPGTQSPRPWWAAALIAISVWGSAPAAAQEPSRHTAASAASAAITTATVTATATAAAAASAAASSASAPALPGRAASAGTADLEQLGQRIDKLAAAVSAAASAGQPNDSWQDAKSVMLNVLSNRIDAFLFGGGSGGVSAGAKLLAGLAVGYAFVKLVLALALLNRGASGGFWSNLRESLCRSRVLAGVRLALAVLALAYTGVAYYLVAGAESEAAASSAQSLEALRSSLQSCQAQLQARPQAQPATGPAAGAASAELMAAVERQGQACVNALRTQGATLSRLQEQVQAVEAAQPSGLSKMLTFLAWVLALGALALLLQRALR